MGGTVAVTLRESDGTVHKMAMHTNPIKAKIFTQSFLNEEREAIDALIKPWQQSQQDWANNQQSGEFENRSTPWYAPYGKLGPKGYGLIVIDFVNQEILSAQDYTKFDYLIASNPILECIKLLSLADKRVVDDEVCAQIAEQQNTELKQLFELFELGAITGIKYCQYKEDDDEVVFDQFVIQSTVDMSFAELMDFCFKRENSRFGYNIGSDVCDVSAYNFVVQPLGFKLLPFEGHDAESIHAMKAHIEKSGFAMDEADITAWNAWFERLKED